MNDLKDEIWTAVLAAEAEYGDRAEEQARNEARRAIASGDILQAAVWDAVADALQVLHSINRTLARDCEIGLGHIGSKNLE